MESQFNNHYDCIVVGLGAHGLATLYELSKRKNFKVLGIEQNSLLANSGSSKGPTRITRQAYFLEHDIYYPLIKGSYDKWEQLEKEVNEKLFLKTGVIYWDDKTDDTNNKNVLSVCKKLNYGYKIIDSPNQQEEPFFEMKNQNYYAVIEQDAGILLADKIMQAFQKVIKSNNVEILWDTKIVDIKKSLNKMKNQLNSNDDVYIIKSNSGLSFTCSNLVLSVGSWLKQNFPFFPTLFKYNNYIKIESALIYHIKLKEGQDNLKMPFYITQPKYHLYGFPDLKDGNFIKIGIFHYYFDDNKNFEKCSDFDEKNWETVLNLGQKYIKNFNKDNIEIVFFSRCCYTMTNDEHYLIDFSPNEKNVLILSPCSGHGFKFCNTIGEYAVDLLEGKSSVMPQFSFSRWDELELKNVKAKY